MFSGASWAWPLGACVWCHCGASAATCFEPRARAVPVASLGRCDQCCDQLDQRRGFPISCCWSSGLVFALCIDFWSDWSTLVLWSVREASFCPFRVVPLRLRRLYWREACRLDGCIGASEGSTVAWFRFRLRLFDGCIGGMRQFRPHATVSSAPFAPCDSSSSAFKRPVRPPIRRSRPPGGLFQRPAGPGSAALCDGRAGKLPRQWKNIQCLSDPLRVAPGPVPGTSEFK